MKSQQEPLETFSYQAKICRFKDIGVPLHKMDKK